MIRRIWVPLFLVTLVSLPARAGFDVPRHVFPIDRLPQAVNKAKDMNQPVAFVFTDAGTSCGLCKAASLDVFNTLSRVAVIVYVDPDSTDRMPSIVQKAMNSPAAGRYVPITVVVDSSFTQVLFVIPYKSDPERRRLLDQVVVKLSSLRVGLEHREVEVFPKAFPDTESPQAPVPSKPAKPVAPAGHTDAKTAASILIITLTWDKADKPSPREKLQLWFLSKGYDFETLESDDGTWKLRIRWEAGGPEPFVQDLENLLNAGYRFTRSGDALDIRYQLKRR